MDDGPLSSLMNPSTSIFMISEVTEEGEIPLSTNDNLRQPSNLPVIVDPWVQNDPWRHAEAPTATTDVPTTPGDTWGNWMPRYLVEQANRSMQGIQGPLVPERARPEMHRPVAPAAPEVTNVPKVNQQETGKCQTFSIDDRLPYFARMENMQHARGKHQFTLDTPKASTGEYNMYTRNQFHDVEPMHQHVTQRFHHRKPTTGNTQNT